MYAWAKIMANFKNFTNLWGSNFRDLIATTISQTSWHPRWPWVVSQRPGWWKFFLKHMGHLLSGHHQLHADGSPGFLTSRDSSPSCNRCCICVTSQHSCDITTTPCRCKWLELGWDFQTVREALLFFFCIHMKEALLSSTEVALIGFLWHFCPFLWFHGVGPGLGQL